MEHSMKISKIKVVNLRIRAFIGFNEEERKKMQDLVISFSFKYNALKAISSDDEKFSLNYKKITKAIIKLVEHQSFLLLETVADKVWALIKNNPYARDVEVRVEKPHALRFCDNVMVEVSDKDRTNDAIISLGSNINPEENIAAAMESLATIGSLVQKTGTVYTKPLKFEDQSDFLNSAVHLRTNLYYEELKLKLREIEQQLKRIRTENKNGPRTIDLDVIVFNDTVVDDDVYAFDFLAVFLKELKPEMVLQ